MFFGSLPFCWTHTDGQENNCIEKESDESNLRRVTAVSTKTALQLPWVLLSTVDKPRIPSPPRDYSFQTIYIGCFPIGPVLGTQPLRKCSPLPTEFIVALKVIHVY